MNYEQQMRTLKNLLLTANKTVVITGAGLSTASGYPDLKAMNQLALNNPIASVPLMELLTNRFAQQHPQTFYQLYRLTHFRPTSQPSTAHQIINQLNEQQYFQGIITYNLDYLHALAGTQNVIEYWGSINENYCVKQHHRFDLNFIQQCTTPYCPIDHSLILPIFVLRNMVAIKARVLAGQKLIQTADLILALGTKLGHGLPVNQAQLVVLNNQPINVSQPIKLYINGSLDQLLTDLKAILINN